MAAGATSWDARPSIALRAAHTMCLGHLPNAVSRRERSGRPGRPSSTGNSSSSAPGSIASPESGGPEKGPAMADALRRAMEGVNNPKGRGGGS